MVAFIVSIPFRAVAGFFDSIPQNYASGGTVFQSLSGLSLGSLGLNKDACKIYFRFNPFQGCRWVLWLTLLFESSQALLFQSLSGLSLGSLAAKMAGVTIRAWVVSIPFRAVAGFFGFSNMRSFENAYPFQSLSGLSLGSLRKGRDSGGEICG